MLFNSVDFLIFSILFFLFWHLAKQRQTLRYLYIIVFSMIFYGWWDWRYLILLIGSGLIDFTVGLCIVRYPRYRLAFLILSICGNLGSLAAFKYGTFFADNLHNLLLSLGVTVNLVDNVPEFLNVLPVGISFYTFQSMSYTFDIYAGKLKPTHNIFHFFPYLAMFPQLVAGPIVRARTLLGQLASKPQVTEDLRWRGTKLIVSGYFMKVVLADNLALFVNYAFDQPEPKQASLYWWLIVIAFAFQIYYDFAGYSRIARGLAYWMGYTFPLNFDHPYIASSLQDFWRRWHITLSTWFRDYVYIPLGGSRVSHLRIHLNLWIVMLLSGLWHGAAWNFVIWGAVHATFYSFERLTNWSTHIRQIPYVGIVLSITTTNIVVLVAWVFFRSSTTDRALFIVNSMFSGTEIQTVTNGFVFWLAISLLFEGALIIHQHVAINYHFVLPRQIEILIVASIIVLTLYFRGPGSTFIYFQF